MSTRDESLFGLAPDDRQLLRELQETRLAADRKSARKSPDAAQVPERFGRIEELPEYKNLQLQFAVAEKMHGPYTLFTCHDGMAKRSTRIGGREFLNFATYDYLGLNGHPEVNAAAVAAMESFGTSAGASRLVAGERPPQALLEKKLADCLDMEAAVVFVSGHATNVSTLATLLGPKDAVYHDALAHNSIILGAVLSGAARYSFPHNDCRALEDLLRRTRKQYERAVIATEGLFSMDGSIAGLPELLEIKRRHTCFLMMDEAHSLGVLGPSGRGSAEHFGLPWREVDICMGTLSKTLCSCGGFIAGSKELVELLKYRAPGFVFSVGISPPLAAASAKALEIAMREPERTRRIQDNSAFFLNEAKSRGMNTGYAEGYAIVPVIVGASMTAWALASAMFTRGVNVLPIIHPAVEEGTARLRFFLSSEHTREDMVRALDILTEELPRARDIAL